MEIKEKDLQILLNHFYNYYFVDYLEEILADDKDELSTVILVQGIEYFFYFCKKNQVETPFNDLESFLKQNYVDWKEIYQTIMERYEREIRDYGDKFNLTFEKCNDRIEF